MYYVYIIECGDGSLYTGITTDMRRRFKEHDSGKGAAYTRSKKVKRVLYFEKVKNRSLASKREASIKNWSRKQKLQFVHEYFFNEAGKSAKKASCLRRKCGAVVMMSGETIGRGFNSPPAGSRNRMCSTDYRTSPKPKSDRTCCVHAEWRAILDAVKNRGDISGSSLYFVSVDGSGNLLRSGDPYCTVCSRLALDAGITYFGLWHEDGITMYETKKYNQLSYDFHKDKLKGAG